MCFGIRTGTLIPRNLHLDSAPPTSVSSETRVVVAVSGASSVEYARRLIEILGDRADVITTKDAATVIEIETGLTTEEFAAVRGRRTAVINLPRPPGRAWPASAAL